MVILLLINYIIMSATITSALVELNPEAKKLQAALNSPWKMRYFFFSKLPTLTWWGVKIKSLTRERGQTTIPYGWRTQNPFQSTYFAAQAGASELSTGMLGMLASAGRGKISMLITGMEAEFVKKATGTVVFTCEDGAAIEATVLRAIETGEGQTFRATSVGVQEDTGVVVSKMYFTWSFKAKSK